MKGLSKFSKAFGIFLLLPAILTVIYAVMIANSEIDIEDVASVSISDGRYVHRYRGKEDIDRYVTLVLESKEGALQDIEDEREFFKIEFEMKKGSAKTYSFYPSLSGESLLKDGTGHIRKASDVSDILCRDEFKKVYEERHLPKLSVDGSQIVPDEYQWFFKKTDENFYEYQDGKKTDNISLLDVSIDRLKGEFAEFSIKPDVMAVEFCYDGNSYQKVENLDLTDGEKITVSLSAKWEKKQESAFYGEGKWTFECVYHKSPIISLNKTEVVAGEFIVITVENGNLGDVLSVDTEIITYKNPQIYKEDNKAFALLPIDVKTKSGDYNVTITLEETSCNFSVNVKNVSKGFAMKNIGAEIYNTVNSPFGKEEYEKFISSVASKTSNTLLWDKNDFCVPAVGDIDTGFGWEVLYNGVPPQLYFEGVSINVPEKTSVKSATNGKVVFSGETSKTGKTIVIDLGCGIMTHYYHLSVLSATEGEEIEANKLIALSGKSGYTDKADLYFAVSINGVFVNPELFGIKGN